MQLKSHISRPEAGHATWHRTSLKVGCACCHHCRRPQSTHQHCEAHLSSGVNCAGASLTAIGSSSLQPMYSAAMSRAMMSASRK